MAGKPLTNQDRAAAREAGFAPSGKLTLPEKMEFPESDPETDNTTLAQALRELADMPPVEGGSAVPILPPDATDGRIVPAWADELQKWWIETATGDIEGSLGKIVQYGGRGAAYDLIATGHDLAAMNGRRGQLTDRQAIELAICFYLSSKVNRWMAAVIDGREPSDDTILDIVYYGMMARRNREVGGWPVASDTGSAPLRNHWTAWQHAGATEKLDFPRRIDGRQETRPRGDTAAA